MNASIISANPSGRIPEPHWLVAFLRLVPDPRVNRTKKHALPDLLMAALCAGLCGYSSFYDMEDFCRVHLDWLRRYCPFAGGVPSHDTFRRGLGLVSPLHFGNVFALWAKLAGANPVGGQIAIDGKALRRALGADGRVRTSSMPSAPRTISSSASSRSSTRKTKSLPSPACWTCWT